MLFRMRCPRCGANVTVPDTAAGTTRKCPACDRSVIEVPAPSDADVVTVGGELSIGVVVGLAAGAIIVAAAFIAIGLFRSPPREVRTAKVKADISPTKTRDDSR